MSLKGFTKAVARLPHLVMAKSGYSTETVDPEFAELEERLKLLDASARKLSDDAKKFKDALASLLAHQESFASTLLEYKETNQESLRAAQEFSNAAQEARQALLPDLETIERKLVAPAADLVCLLDNVKSNTSVQKVIVKRSHKLLDYDRHRETVKKLKEKERTVSDEKSLAKAELAFDVANREYSHLNNLLKREIPVLLGLKSSFMDPCFHTLYTHQARAHATLLNAYSQLARAAGFDMRVSVAVGFEARVAAQAALLDDVAATFRSAARRSVNTTSPLSPDYVPPVSTASAASASGAGSPAIPSAMSPQQQQQQVLGTAEPPSYSASALAGGGPNSFKNMHTAASPYAGRRASEDSDGGGGMYVTALYDFDAQAPGDLSFRRNDRIEFLWMAAKAKKPASSAKDASSALVLQTLDQFYTLPFPETLHGLQEAVRQRRQAAAARVCHASDALASDSSSLGESRCNTASSDGAECDDGDGEDADLYRLVGLPRAAAAELVAAVVSGNRQQPLPAAQTEYSGSYRKERAMTIIRSWFKLPPPALPPGSLLYCPAVPPAQRHAWAGSLEGDNSPGGARAARDAFLAEYYYAAVAAAVEWGFSVLQCACWLHIFASAHAAYV
ncbi:hypothetical protein HDU82_001078, partial [Entophlyctis luteolus]